MRKKDESITELAEVKFLQPVKGCNKARPRCKSRNKTRAADIFSISENKHLQTELDTAFR
jgi:hypothetical protein